MAAEDNKMIRVISCDGEPFEMAEAAASLSRILRHMIEDDCADGAGITLPNVAAKPLAKIVEYCTKHAAASVEGSSSTAAAKDQELKSFDDKFIDVDTDTLYHLLMAANFMGVEGLLNLAVQRMAELIMGKSPEQIRDAFKIENDFTPEEEEEIRKENAWAFQ